MAKLSYQTKKFDSSYGLIVFCVSLMSLITAIISLISNVTDITVPLLNMTVLVFALIAMIFVIVSLWSFNSQRSKNNQKLLQDLYILKELLDKYIQS